MNAESHRHLVDLEDGWRSEAAWLLYRVGRFSAAADVAGSCLQPLEAVLRVYAQLRNQEGLVDADLLENLCTETDLLSAKRRKGTSAVRLFKQEMM